MATVTRAMRPPPPGADRLLAIIAIQNEIAAAALDMASVMRVVASRAALLTAASGSVIEVVDGTDMVHRAAAGSAAQTLGLRRPRAQGLSGRCVVLGEPLRSDDTAHDDRVDVEVCQRLRAVSMICVPLVHDGTAVGAVTVVSSLTGAFDGEDVETLRLLAGIVVTSMRQAAAYQSTRHASLHDPLTGLPNRRAFDAQLAHELLRARQLARPVTLAMLDLDGFKAVNDRAGHAAGDRVLRQIAELLLASIRRADRCYRLGGDEFAILMCDTGAKQATLVLARVRDAVLAAGVGGGSLDVSVGLAEASPEGTAEELVAQADQALCAEKRSRSAER
jgi:diguanylate cyclase (GGDEF)-like protein